MLQEYHRQTTIKSFAPILKDRSSKRWDCENSLPTNLSLLSISDSSKSSHDDDENDIHIFEQFQEEDSPSSRGSISSPINEGDEHRVKRVDLDPYILNKHLNGISSTTTYLEEVNIDKSVNELFDDSKSLYRYDVEDYDPRAIRPPPFSQYIEQVQESQTKVKSNPRRSSRIAVRTTKAEQLKLARQQSANTPKLNLPPIRSSTVISPQKSSRQSLIRQPIISPINRIAHLRRDSIISFKQSESARSCKDALQANTPLALSEMLVKQMRQDIKSNRVPAYSKPLNSALLRERPHPPLTRQYKMKRIRHWLNEIIPTDYIEYNEYASNETTFGTNFNDKLDDEYDLLSDEKRPNHIERTLAEAHRALPLFQSEIYRKMRHHNLLLTRLELDLYVI